MRSGVDLKIVQYRPQMLYARRLVRCYAPFAILLGFVLWEIGIFLFGTGAGLAYVAACALACLLCFVATPLMMKLGAWLIIDQMRGWIHYRHIGLRDRSQESFSPRRIDSLRIRRHGLPGGQIGWWKLELRLDHPRLASVCLMRSWDRRRIERVAGDLSAFLSIDWYDGQGVRHHDEPLTIGMQADSTHTHRNLMPPPPEIEIHTHRGRQTLVLPHPEGLSHGVLMFLVYAFVWCLWSWTSLSLEGLELGSVVQIGGRQFAILTLLLVASIAGVLMLARALYGMLAQEELQAAQSGWVLVRRWLGIPFGSHRLSPLGIKGLRRIEPPNRQAGLWIGHASGEIRLGMGLSVEALSWLQAMLRNDPHALHANRSPAAETRLSASLESGPGKSIRPTVLTGG